MAGRDVALIVGVGPGLGAALGRRFAREGFEVALASRTEAKVGQIAIGIGPKARAYGCDATRESDVEALFTAVGRDLGAPGVVVFNASGRVRKPLIEIGADEFERAWRNACLGGFLVGRAAARQMLTAGRGTILFTGATASVKAYARSAGFAVGKFGLRALAQSMAREMGPRGVHVAHVIVDGGIHGPHHAPEPDMPADHLLDPDAIADAYWALHTQHRSAWTHEIDLRPWVESF